MTRSSAAKLLLGVVVSTAVGGLFGGCNSDSTSALRDKDVWIKNIGDYLNLRNGFLDPSQVGRFDKAKPWGVSKPVQWPILEQLDAMDEPDTHWIGATDPLPGDLVVEQKEYVVGEGDFLSLSVYELVLPGTPYTDQRQVNELGNVTVQNLGQVHVAGLTPSQIEEKIGQLAVDKGFLQPKSATSPGPQVSVQLAQSRARIFSALGQVGASGTYNIIGNDFRMLDALALARDILGGSQPGMDYLYVIRPQQGAGVVTPAEESQPTTTTPQTNPLNTLDKLKPSSNAKPSKPQPGNDSPTFVREIPKEMLTMDQPGSLAQANLDSAISGNEGTRPGPATTPTTSQAPSGSQPPPSDLDQAISPSKPQMKFDNKWVGVEPAAGNTSGLTQEQAIAAAQSLSGPRVIRIPIDKLKEGDPRYNIVIRPGDIINVPNIMPGEFYLYGHVGRPGVYSLTGRKVTLKMALAAAGGLDSVAIPRRCDLVRRVGNTEVTLQIDLQRIFDGEQPDIYLKANDWINVGTDMIAPFLAVTRNAYRLTYGAGFTYDRNFYIQPPTPANN